MKKIISAMFLIAAVLSFSIVTASAKTDTLLCGFENGAKPYSGTGYIFNANATYCTTEKSVAIQPVGFGENTGALGDFDTAPDSPGVRRTQLYELPQTVPAGEYEVTVWVTDPVGLIMHKDSDFGVLVSFHAADMLDDDLMYQWYDDDYTISLIKIFDNHGKTVAGDSYMDATMVKGDTKTGNDGKEWTAYTVTVTLSSDAGKVAFWLWQPGGELGDYDNKYQKTDGHQVYFDDLTLKAASAVFEGGEEEPHVSERESVATEPNDDTSAVESESAPPATSEKQNVTEPNATEPTQSESKTADPADSEGSNTLWIVIIAIAAVVIIGAIIFLIAKKKK